MVVVRISRQSLAARSFDDSQVILQEEFNGDVGTCELANIIVAAVAIDEESQTA